MSEQFNKGKQLIVAIILGILTYWLFAQSFLNIAPHVQRFYHVDMSIVNIAVSLTSLLTGVFIVVAGGLSDKILILLRGIPESKDESAYNKKFDIVGIIIFVVMMLSINVVITQGDRIGWLNPLILILIAIFIVTLIAFYIFEKRQDEPFIDLSLFSNNVYIGTTLANLMVNMDIGSLALFNIYVQDDKHLSAAQAGLITIPYMLCSLLMIRVGERFMQKRGPQLPLMLGPVSITVGIIYYIVACIGFIFIGLGLGFFATPALSTAVSNVPSEKAGTASGIIKMTSTLGAAFGIAVVTTIYTALSVNHPAYLAATIAFIVGAGLVFIAFIAAYCLIPKKNVDI
ncbi:MAG: MFS transporter [Staphylococcus epidermidis]|nr:MFS transporter [Staphylococcus epidermidis]